MHWYSRVVFPRLCDLLLRQPFVTVLRRQLLVQVHGEILEIGFGTGLNLPCYPSRVRKITTVDPNAGMHELALRRIRRTGIDVDHHVQSGEKLPFTAGTFDCVVSTFTLCSIDQVEHALAEVHRVLRPGGRFVFLEHGLSPRPSIQKWQRRLNWLERKLADGCRLDRDMTAIVSTQPFAELYVEQFEMDGMPPTHGHMYRGTAVR